MCKILFRKVVLRVAEELNERRERAPWVRPVDNESFEQNPRDDLAETTVLNLREQVQNHGAEPVGVCIRVAQVHNHGTHQMILTWGECISA